MPRDTCHLPQDYVENPRQYNSIEFCHLRIRDYLGWKQFCFQLTAHNVESIDIRGTKLDKHLAKELGTAIAKCPFLHTLKLESNSMHNTGLYYIAKGISQNNSIQNLYISYNRFDNVGFSYLLKALQINNSVQYLHLWNNNFVTEEGLKQFASLIKKNSNIIGVCLTSYRLTSDVRESIIKALQENFMMEEFMMWFEDRGKIRSILSTNLNSFERIASKLVYFMLYHHYPNYFPPLLGRDNFMEIVSFLSYKERETLLEVEDMVSILKTMIAQRTTESFEKEMMDCFMEYANNYSWSRKERTILQKIRSLYV